MNSMAKPDLHPDADILNAFVEHALPESERVRVVAHMADCPRCRQVVFLAQAVAEPVPARVLKPDPQPGWLSSAFARWRIALIPAAALATIGATVLWVQLRPVLKPTQMAKTIPPQAPAFQVPSPASPAAEKKAVPPPQLHAQQVSPGQTSSAPAKSAQPAPRPNADQKVPSNAGLLAFENAAPSGPPAARAGQGAIHLDGHTAAMARRAPRLPILAAPPVPAFSASQPNPGPQAEQAQQQARSMDAQPSVAAASAPAANAPPSPSTSMVSAAAPGSADASSALTQVMSEPVLAPQQMHGLALTRLAGRVKLPNGLNSLSSATVLNRMVAVDSAGGLFFSEDGGSHWTVVPARWTGKAVEVNAATTPNASQGFFAVTSAAKPKSPEFTAVSTPPPPATNRAADNTPPAPPPPAAGTSTPVAARTRNKAKPAPPVIPPIFRLVTDSHEVWLSADGKVWRPQ